MVCFRYIIVNTLHQGENKDRDDYDDDDDDDDNNDNNNNNNNNNNLRDLGFKNVDGLTKTRFAYRIL